MLQEQFHQIHCIFIIVCGYAGTAIALLGTYLYTEAGRRFKPANAATPAPPSKPSTGGTSDYTGPTPRAVWAKGRRVSCANETECTSSKTRLLFLESGVTLAVPCIVLQGCIYHWHTVLAQLVDTFIMIPYIMQMRDQWETCMRDLICVHVRLSEPVYSVRLNLLYTVTIIRLYLELIQRELRLASICSCHWPFYYALRLDQRFVDYEPLCKWEKDASVRIEEKCFWGYKTALPKTRSQSILP